MLDTWLRHMLVKIGLCDTYSSKLGEYSPIGIHPPTLDRTKPRPEPRPRKKLPGQTELAWAGPPSPVQGSWALTGSSPASIRTLTPGSGHRRPSQEQLGQIGALQPHLGAVRPKRPPLPNQGTDAPDGVQGPTKLRPARGVLGRGCPGPGCPFHSSAVSSLVRQTLGG